MNRIVLAYSGGFEAAAAIVALKAQHAADVVVVTMDLGQGQVLEELRDRALAAGAVRAHVLDLRETFAARYVLPSLKADALGDDGAPLAGPLGGALVAEKLVEMAAIEQAETVAHGAGSALLDTAISTINPKLRIVTVPSTTAAEAGHRFSVNLWGRTIQGDGGGVRPATHPAEAASAEIRFERGAPVSINGVPMPLVDLIGSLTFLAAAHGVGRILTAGALVEAPAAVALHAAHRELQKRVASKDGDRVSRQYADIIARGLWSTPARAALDKTVEKSQKRVNGAVRLKLFQGACELVATSD